MFLIARIVFARNAQDIYAIVAERKNPFFRINPFLYENKKELREMETTVEYLSTNC